MYHLHHTDAFIIAARPSGEADRRYRIYTRELGLLTASARSVRSLSSKLRYALQPLSSARVVLVRGKGGWRVANAVASPPAPRVSIARRRTLALLVGTLARMLPEEEPVPGLFDDFSGHIEAVRSSVDEAEAALISRVIVLRHLSVLGYVGEDPDVSDLSALGPIDAALIRRAFIRERAIEDAIARAVSESHL